MPTILRERGFRFVIFVDEPNEPAHVHVFKDDKSAKVRLTPAIVIINRGFRPHEISEFLAVIEAKKTHLVTEYERIHGTN